MIPDGTSLSSVSLARWYQRYCDSTRIHLNMDEFLCGTVLTFSSDAPIGDSAPTTSCYMTGMPSQTGFVASYPVATDHDLIPVDPKRARRPLATLLEAGKWLLGKKTALVVTCEFTHATPADCSAHSYKRGRRDWIAPQMVNLPVDILLGGGTALITPELNSTLKEQGITYIEKDIEAMRRFDGDKMWALFADYALPYDLDRDPQRVPSLEEMTRKSLSLLEKNNEKGFFLMIEGSKVDWAAHANDPVGVATEMLAFDRAVGAAIEFARKDNNTAVVILPDHGNSGLSIGLQRLKGYDKASAHDLFSHLTSIRKTADGMAQLLNESKEDRAVQIFKEQASIDLSKEELDALYNSPDYVNSPLPASERKGSSDERGLYNKDLSAVICGIYKKHLPIGFTTHGHTGEEVFLACYHPHNDRPQGMILNTEINEYLCRLWGLEGKLPQLTEIAYAPHSEVFAGYKATIVGEPNKIPNYLEVSLPKGKLLRIYPFTPKMAFGSKNEFKKGKQRLLKAPNNAVWVDKNNAFYLNREVLKMVLQR